MNHDAKNPDFIFVIGDGKNAGKTTFLKHLLNKKRKDGFKTLLLSSGIDGELCDNLTGGQKPDIVVEKGDFIITSEEAINSSEARFKIVEVFETETSKKKERPILAETLRKGAVEIVRSGSNQKTSLVVKEALEKIKPDLVFVDGAADRMTQIASSKKAGFYYVLKVDSLSLPLATSKVKRIFLMSNFKIDTKTKNDDKLFLNGALTKNKAIKISDKTKVVVAEDLTRIFLDIRELKSFLKKHELRFETGYELLGIVVVLYDVGKEEFLSALACPEINDKIIFNPYECDAA